MKNQETSSPPEENAKKETGLTFNCWLDPNFDPSKVLLDLQNQINGRYPYVDQTGFYIDPLGALGWIEVSRQKEYSEVRRSISYSKVSELIGHILAQSQGITEVDLIILGPGEASDEVVLVQHLYQYFKKMRVFLIDASNVLLRQSWKVMNQALSHINYVEIFGIESDFRCFWQYINQMSPPVSYRRRVIVAFTILYNLQDEYHFIHNNFLQLSKGDLLIFDFWHTLGSLDNPEQIRKQEPRLSEQSINVGWDKALDDWHYQILRRACTDLEQVSFSYVLSYQGCPIPDSYSIDKLAYIRHKDGSDYVLVLQRYKRYNAEKLVYTLQREGLLPLQIWYSPKTTHLSLYLFEKVNNPYETKGIIGYDKK